jgi:hypothetical protein
LPNIDLDEERTKYAIVIKVPERGDVGDVVEKDI